MTSFSHLFDESYFHHFNVGRNWSIIKPKRYRTHFRHVYRKHKTFVPFHILKMEPQWYLEKEDNRVFLCLGRARIINGEQGGEAKDIVSVSTEGDRISVSTI